MHSHFFKSKEEITKVAVGVVKLLGQWGIKPCDWMMGKYLSFYFNGVYGKAKEVNRDISIYILKKALPSTWQVAENVRSVIPSQGEHFKSYSEFQRKYNVGLDFTPIPGSFLIEKYITENVEITQVGGYEIYCESIEKFLYRMNLNHAKFMGRPVQEFKDFYYVDKKRYEDRIKFYYKIGEYLENKPDFVLLKQLGIVISGFKKIIYRTYPEIFKKIIIDHDPEIKGFSAVVGKGLIRGKVKLYKPDKRMLRGKEKLIYVFKHFSPAEVKILPLAKVVVVDGGGLLSHASIVCREMGKPCIVGAKVAYQVLRDGELVEIDTDLGTIKRIK